MKSTSRSLSKCIALFALSACNNPLALTSESSTTDADDELVADAGIVLTNDNGGTGGDDGSGAVDEGTGGDIAAGEDEEGGEMLPEPPRPMAPLPDVAALTALGKAVFFDPISEPAGVMSCASCHAPEAGWVSADSAVNLGQVAVPGAVSSRAGNRKPPSSAYATFSPFFGDASSDFACTADDAFAVFCVGGLFWDGRATGSDVGAEVFAGYGALAEAYGRFLGPAVDQALGPFANDVEQNVPDGNDNGLAGAEYVCEHVLNSDYADLYEQAWGELPDCQVLTVDISFKRIAVAIAAFEQSAEVNAFSSKRDNVRETALPYAGFTDQENLGQALFFGVTTDLNPTGKDAKCAACHNSGLPESEGHETNQVFTDHRYHALGLPPNPEAAHYDAYSPDRGLGHHTGADGSYTNHDGAFRTPTLRNVAKGLELGLTKAYMHNGYFKSLEDVVHFYNTALVKLDPEACPAGTTAAEAREQDCWPAPEIGDQTGAFGNFGDLGLTEEEEAAVVAYLHTLSDATVDFP